MMIGQAVPFVFQNKVHINTIARTPYTPFGKQISFNAFLDFFTPDVKHTQRQGRAVVQTQISVFGIFFGYE